ncbi:retrotransposon protein, putative, ty1-copia subclass [Tanacetum coccineum]
METEVANCSVDKKYFEIEKKELIIKNDRLLEHIICQDIMNVIVHADVHNLLISQDLVHTAVNSLAAINDYKSMEQSLLDEYEENLKLQIELDKKNDMIEKAVYNELSKRCLQLENRCISLEIKLQQRKESLQNKKPSLNQNAPEFKEFFIINDLQAQFKAKDVSIEKSKEHIANLERKNVVESATTMANLNVEHTEILRDIGEQARALKPLYNVLDYALSSSTEASGSNPRSNTKKDRITQTSSSNKKKNKVEDHPRIAKSSLNNKNHVSKPVCNANVKHSVLNAISKLVCATCNECMFDAIHDLCVRDYLNDVNDRVKSNSMKSKSSKSNRKKIWKPTDKMATTDKESSAAGTDNRPPMLEESDFESWKIRIERYISGKPLGKLIWKSIKNGPSPHPMITITTGEGEQQTQVTREKTDKEFTEAENNKERADIQATNILRSGLTKQQKKETLFDQYEKFWANGNESIHDYFYVTIVKNSKDISTVSYVDLYTHLKSDEQHALKNLSKMNQTSRNADPLAYMAKATQSTSSPSQYVPSTPQNASAPQQAPQSTNDVMLATMNQITQATIQVGQITTESVQRRASGNKGKHAATGSQRKVVTCYNCRGEGHVARECKEKKRAKDSQWFKDKKLLMEAKAKGDILDAEAEAFLADVECTTPYAEPLAIITTMTFEVSHEDAYHSDVEEAPHAAATFMANLMQTGPSTGQGTSNDIDFHSKIHGGEQLDCDVDSVIDDHDNTIPYHQYQLNNEVKSVPTDVSSVVPGEIFVITILDDLRSQLEGHIKTNEEQSFANDSLKVELERYKTQVQNLEQTFHENLLQSYGQPVQTIPISCTYPLRVYDSEETLVQAKVSRTKMLERMKDPLCKVSSKPINYAKLNSLYDTFVPQKQLSREQVYWLPANEVASYNCNQSKPVTNFVRTRPAKSQVNTQLKMLKACFLEFGKVVKDRMTPSYITNGEWHFEHTKKCFVEEIIPFYEKLKTHVKRIEDNLFKEVSEYMKILDELYKEYDQCVIDKKS